MEGLLYACVNNVTEVEEDVVSARAIARFSSRADSTFGPQLKKGTWGATVFFSQFDVVAKQLGVNALLAFNEAKKICFINHKPIFTI